MLTYRRGRIYLLHRKFYHHSTLYHEIKFEAMIPSKIPKHRKTIYLQINSFASHRKWEKVPIRHNHRAISNRTNYPTSTQSDNNEVARLRKR